MTRRSQRIAFGSVSALAIAAVLTACSQPASHAVVDLSGSYGGKSVNAYSALTGEPVYTATSLYGAQSYPDYVPNSQLADVDAPTNQVASLGYGPGQFDTYNTVPTYQPTYESQGAYSSPVMTNAPLLSTSEFQTELSQVEPLDRYESIGSLDAAAPLAPVETFTSPIAPVETVYAAPYFDDANATSPQAIESAPLPDITSAPLPEITSAPLGDISAAPQTGFNDPMSLSVGDDYVSWDQPPATALPTPEPVYQPDTAFTSEAADLLPQEPQQTRLPAPNAVPPRALENTGRTPKASGAYPRPYELLRPGVYPDLGNGQGLVEAPIVTPLPEVAFVRNADGVAEVQPIDRASTREKSYMIRLGDTLSKIAEREGVPLAVLLSENALEKEATIYAGQSIAIPMIETADETAVLEDAPSAFDDEPIPSVDLDTIRKVLGAAEPIQPASIPVRDEKSVAKSFDWPVHGEVYKLGAGQIEIDADGISPVGATASGQVVGVERGSLGVLVVIEHENGWRSLTVGMRMAHVRVGDTVVQGTRIGTATGDHRVRFELRDAQSDLVDALDQLRG